MLGYLQDLHGLARFKSSSLVSLALYLTALGGWGANLHRLISIFSALVAANNSDIFSLKPMGSPLLALLHLRKLFSGKLNRTKTLVSLGVFVAGLYAMVPR